MGAYFGIDASTSRLREAPHGTIRRHDRGAGSATESHAAGMAATLGSDDANMAESPPRRTRTATSLRNYGFFLAETRPHLEFARFEEECDATPAMYPAAMSHTQLDALLSRFTRSHPVIATII